MTARPQPVQPDRVEADHPPRPRPVTRRTGLERTGLQRSRHRRAGLRRTGPLGLAGLLLTGLALAAGPGPASATPPAPVAAETVVEAPVPSSRYLSAPPSSWSDAVGTAPAEEPEPEPDPDPAPAPTRGSVVGRVLTPEGRPLAGALVQGIRFDDLGAGINLYREQPVQARTDADGRFRLPQLRERYLVEVCDAGPTDQQCGSDLAPDRYAATYRGPDGVRDSWVTHTRMYRPVQPTRSVGTFRMRPYARLSGTVRGVEPGTLVRLVRGDGSEAHRVRVGEGGRYAAAVAPGRYRVEVDRIEGLRTASTVPGYRSRCLRLTATRPTSLSFGTAPAAGVTGLLTIGGEPVAERLVVIIDRRGRWAAGAVTDEAGRYRVDSLKPGRYRVQTLNLSSDEVPVSRAVRLTNRTVVRADLETAAGTSVRFTPVDGDRVGAVALEVRDGDGELVKALVLDAGQRVRLPGFGAGSYTFVLRRWSDPFDDTTGTSFPWAQRTVVATGDGVVDLGQVRLDRPTLSLTGTLPRGAQVKFATVPADAVLRPQFVQGPGATALTQQLTEQADARGRYTSTGFVPGRYSVTVSTALKDPADKPSTTGANVAVTRSTVVVGDHDRKVDLTAPVGGVITARLRYEGTHRPLIAPVGLAVRDRGPVSTLFPTVSGPQTAGRGLRVDRLHTGRVTARLLDRSALVDAAEADGTRVPDTLLYASAPLAEARTPYWFTARERSARVVEGRTTRLGTVPVRVRR